MKILMACPGDETNSHHMATPTNRFYHKMPLQNGVDLDRKRSAGLIIEGCSPEEVHNKTI